MNLSDTDDALVQSHVNRLKTRLKEIQQELGSHNITRSRKQFKADTIKQEIVERREVLVPELISIEAELMKYSAFTKPQRDRHHDLWSNYFVDVVKETVGEDIAMLMKKEASARLDGNPATMVRLKSDSNQAEEIKRISAIAKDLKMKLILARRAIESYINENEPEVNKGDYLRQVSKLNKAVTSESEINKIKIQ